MIVFHGSYTEINEIDLTQSEPYKDFGKGFYVTKFKEQAEFWAERKGRKNDTAGFVTEFEFNDYAFESKRIRSVRFKTYNDEWFDFVIQNRKNNTNSHDYDIVEGPVADDKINTRISEFLKGEISREDFFADLKWHEETHQICFCTVASLQFIEHTENSKNVFKFLHISEPIIEELIIDFGFDEQTASDKFFTSKTFTETADTSTKLYLKDWTEIYKLLLAELNLKPTKK